MPLAAALLAFIAWTVIRGTTSKYVAFATQRTASPAPAPSPSLPAQSVAQSLSGATQIFGSAINQPLGAQPSYTPPGSSITFTP